MVPVISGYTLCLTANFCHELRPIVYSAKTELKSTLLKMGVLAPLNI